MEIDNIEDLDIKTIMLDNNKILEINVESSELFLIFQDSLNINKLNKIKYFQNEKEILQIKKTIDTLLKEKKFSSKYDEKLGILTLTFKPTSNENDDWEINTNLFDENKILEINAENATDLLYFNKSYNITQLKNIEYFQSFNKIQKIKEKIDKLIQANKYYIELDQKLGILTLKFKPTSNENFTIYLNENRNVTFKNNNTKIFFNSNIFI